MRPAYSLVRRLERASACGRERGQIPVALSSADHTGSTRVWDRLAARLLACHRGSSRRREWGLVEVLDVVHDARRSSRGDTLVVERVDLRFRTLGRRSVVVVFDAPAALKRG